MQSLIFLWLLLAAFEKFIYNLNSFAAHNVSFRTEFIRTIPKNNIKITKFNACPFPI